MVDRYSVEMSKRRTCFQRDRHNVPLVHVQLYVRTQDIFILLAPTVTALLDAFSLATLGQQRIRVGAFQYLRACTVKQ